MRQLLPVLAALLLTAGCALTAAGPPPAGSPPSNDIDWAMQNRLSEAAQQVQELIEERAPGSYGSIITDQENARLSVYRKPSPGIDEAIAALAPADRTFSIAVHDAKFSADELQTLSRRVVEQDSAFWRDRGVEVVGAGPEPDASVLNVQVRTDDLAAAQREADQRYGASVVRMAPGSEAIPADPLVLYEAPPS